MMQPSFQPSGIPPHQSMARQVSMPGITTQQQPGMVRKVPPNPVPPASAVAIGGGVVSASAAGRNEQSNHVSFLASNQSTRNFS